MSAATLAVVHANTERTWRGGERQVVLLARRQRDMGHRVLLACRPDGALWARATEAGLQTTSLRVAGEWDLLAAMRLRRLVLEASADIVHLHTPHTHMLSVLAPAGLGAAVVVHRRVDFPLRANPISRAKYRSHRVHRYIAVSRRVAEVLREGGVEQARIEVVRSSVEAPRVLPREEVNALRCELAIEPGETVVGGVGSLVDHKGFSYLVKAFRDAAAACTNSRLRLVLIGDGPLRRGLESQSQALGLNNRITFVGHSERPTDLMQIFDLFVAPSKLEGLNTSILDAMCLGIPVIATMAGGIPEVVTVSTGWQVRPRNSADLCAAILLALNQRDEAQRRSRRARDRVAKIFSVERMADETISVYRVAIREAGAR